MALDRVEGNSGQTKRSHTHDRINETASVRARPDPLFDFAIITFSISHLRRNPFDQRQTLVPAITAAAYPACSRPLKAAI